MFRVVSFIVATMLVGATVFAFRAISSTPLRAAADTPQRRVHPVQTNVVSVCDSFQCDHDYLGEVVPSRTSKLGFERRGRIVAMDLHEGDRFSKGDLLAQLDTTRLEERAIELEARVRQARARLDELIAGPRRETIEAAEATVEDLAQQLELANRNRERRSKLVSQAFAAQEELEEAMFGARSLAAKLEAAKFELAELKAGTRSEVIQAQQATLSQVKSLLAQNQIEIERSVIRAPYDCTITAQMADVGQVVSEGIAILNVIANESPEVWIGVPLDRSRLLKTGQEITVQIDQRTYPAIIRNVVPQLEQSTRTVTVILGLNEVSITEVPAGQMARLTVAETVEQRGCWLPVTSLVKGTRGLWSCLRLVREKPDFHVDDLADKTIGRLERCDVEILHSDGEQVFARSTLDDGDLVVAQGINRVTPRQWAYTSRELEVAKR